MIQTEEKQSLMLTEDFEQTWEKVSPDFMVDAVREFNDYPEVVLAWAAYI